MTASPCLTTTPSSEHGCGPYVATERRGPDSHGVTPPRLVAIDDRRDEHPRESEPAVASLLSGLGRTRRGTPGHHRGGHALEHHADLTTGRDRTEGRRAGDHLGQREHLRGD